MTKCLLCSSRDTRKTVTGTSVCDACRPKWVAMRKRSFTATVFRHGCTGSVNDDGVLIHDANCDAHQRWSA
jgi:hypothetical protein